MKQLQKQTNKKSWSSEKTFENICVKMWNGQELVIRATVTLYKWQRRKRQEQMKEIAEVSQLLFGCCLLLLHFGLFLFVCLLFLFFATGWLLLFLVDILPLFFLLENDAPCLLEDCRLPVCQFPSDVIFAFNWNALISNFVEILWLK